MSLIRLWPAGADNFLFAAEHGVVGADRHQVGVGPVGDVLDQSDRQPEKAAVIVNRRVEVTAGKQERTGKDEVANAAVGEIERTGRSG